MIETIRINELFQKVNPEDLVEVLNFSGIQDHDSFTKQDKYHFARRYLQLRLDPYLNSWLEKRENPECDDSIISKTELELLLRNIQDYYFWSHQMLAYHLQVYTARYVRVCLALGISIKEVQDFENLELYPIKDKYSGKDFQKSIVNRLENYPECANWN